MAKFRAPSAAVLAARKRSAGKADTRIDWFIDNVATKVKMPMKQRVKVATEHLKSKVVRNLSTPVIKGTGPRGGRVVRNRSKPGEFPRADTTRLQKDVFADTKTRAGVHHGYVGVTVDYGLILEIKMDRSFLVRTLREERSRITKILTGPIA